MTVRPKQSTQIPPSPAPVVLFGLDSRGKPKAARFTKNLAGLAIKAATQLHLKVLTSTDPTVAAIAARLPVGRVYATGRTFVPFVRRDLYDKLLAAAPNGNVHQPAAPPPNGATGSPGPKPPGSVPNLPRSWEEITLGDLILVQDSLEEGWYEGVVVDADGDMLTLRWRDYPRERRVTRHRTRLGLLYPGHKSAAGRPVV
jgi:hypothetical protein